MSNARKIILVAGCVAFAAMWLFPPLTAMAHLGDSPPDTFGFRFSERELKSVTQTLVVNERQLFHQQVALIVLMGALWFVFRPRKSPRNEKA